MFGGDGIAERLRAPRLRARHHRRGHSHHQARAQRRGHVEHQRSVRRDVACAVGRVRAFGQKIMIGAIPRKKRLFRRRRGETDRRAGTRLLRLLGLGASSAESRRARERRGCRRSGVRVRVGLVRPPRRASAPPTFSRRRRRPARAKARDAVGGWSRAVGFPSRAASIGRCARTHRVRRAIPASVLPSPVVGHHRASTGAAHSQPPRREK